MLGGYKGYLLRIDLGEEKVEKTELQEYLLKKYIGGSGLAARFLYEMVDKNTDPLGEENPLIYMTGPFTGSKVPASGRHEITALSPLTGIFGEGDVGGYWGKTLKEAGYDGIIFTGRSSRPVYVYIDGDKVEIKSAEKLWGLDTYKTDETLKEIYSNDIVTSCIGPAGENLVPLANIMHDGKDARAVGRAGLGAVMGSKNLKAVVVKGNEEIKINNLEKLMEKQKEILPTIVKSTEGMKELGTAGGVEGAEALGDLPIKNWQQGFFEKAEEISGLKMKNTILKSNYYCYSCPIGCGREVDFEKEDGTRIYGAGAEYETTGTMGSNLLIDDIEVIAEANFIANKLGLDTISTGQTIAFAMELNEEGIKPFADSKLEWGNGEALLEAIENIAYKRDLGDLLADGVKKLAEKIGQPEHPGAVHVKGLEFPAHDPRAFSSLAVGYATSNRGACHLQGATYTFEKGVLLPELGYTEKQDRFASEGKGVLNFHAQNLMSLMDSLKLCKFLLYGKVTLTDILDWIEQVIGWKMSVEELVLTGERLYNLKRMINNIRGVSREDDTLPSRILNDPRDDGDTRTRNYLPPLKEMLEEYYDIRGWDEEGKPNKEKLIELSLFEILSEEDTE
ncbi:MAG: aldehyde ferredoxin oxidoreductase family protein [Bacillota bacterium]